jgi:hypothetical protein
MPRRRVRTLGEELGLGDGMWGWDEEEFDQGRGICMAWLIKERYAYRKIIIISSFGISKPSENFYPLLNIVYYDSVVKNSKVARIVY